MKQQTVIPDAIRFAPLRVDRHEGGGWLVMTRRDETPGTLNNFSLAECQHREDAVFFASAPDLLRQRDKLKQSLAGLEQAIHLWFTEGSRASGQLRDLRKLLVDDSMSQARAILAEAEDSHA